MNPRPLTLGVLIRFANSEATLPAVLAALGRQTLQPDVILGVASHSTDGSRVLLENRGAKIIQWTERYDHSRVLNFGLGQLTTDLVLVLSAHTVLESSDAVARMVACFEDDRVACASAKWDQDPYFSDAVTWEELKAKGLRFGSIYSNSMGMIRRALWEKLPFDESLPGSEDYAWAVSQLALGHICCRLDFRFGYQRSGHRRDGEFARVAFVLARRHGLRVAWLGAGASVRKLIQLLPKRDQRHEYLAVKERLLAWCSWRLGATKA